jgi:glutamate-ammonia-ligase adenylyltransferase
MEKELGKETPGRYHVKYGRGGLVDVEFLVQALQLVHGAEQSSVRRVSTTAALEALGRAGALDASIASELADHYRFLRRVSAAVRLFGARPADSLDLAGPIPARVATALGYASRAELLDDYRRRTDAVRAAYREALA